MEENRAEENQIQEQEASEEAGVQSELERENERLRMENERLKNLSPKERLYDKINVSVRTMDYIIGGLLVLLAVVLVLGMINR